MMLNKAAATAFRNIARRMRYRIGNGKGDGRVGVLSGAVALILLSIAVGPAQADSIDTASDTLRPAVHKAPCPRIPGSSDIDLTADEWLRVDAGEIIVRIVTEGDDTSRAQAIGYLSADPIALFDLATDAGLAPEIVDEVQSVVVLEAYPDGQLATGRIKAAQVLPAFEYTFASRYLPSRTGQCWGQVDGDFLRNEGAHSFLWDPDRGQTLAVFSSTIGMKGLLSFIPQRLVLQGAADTLPSFMRSLESLRAEMATKDPARTRRLEEQWARTRPLIESGDFPGRMWSGYASPAEDGLARHTPLGEPDVEAR